MNGLDQRGVQPLRLATEPSGVRAAADPEHLRGILGTQAKELPHVLDALQKNADLAARHQRIGLLLGRYCHPGDQRSFLRSTSFSHTTLPEQKRTGRQANQMRHRARFAVMGFFPPRQRSYHQSLANRNP